MEEIYFTMVNRVGGFVGDFQAGTARLPVRIAG
jgi:hypothetical protein